MNILPTTPCPELFQNLATSIFQVQSQRNQQKAKIADEDKMKPLMQRRRLYAHPSDHLPYNIDALTKTIESVFNKTSSLPRSVRDFIQSGLTTQVMQNFQHNSKAQQVNKRIDDDSKWAGENILEYTHVKNHVRKYNVTKGSDLSTDLDDPLYDVAYKGTLTDGTVFDENEHASFRPSQVVPGFGTALRSMSPGETATFYFPSDQGYGDQGSGDKIPGGASLIFEITVHSIEGADIETLEEA